MSHRSRSVHFPIDRRPHHVLFLTLKHPASIARFNQKVEHLATRIEVNAFTGATQNIEQVLDHMLGDPALTKTIKATLQNLQGASLTSNQ